MISITDEATLEMKKAVADKGDSPCVRIYVAGFGWGGPSLGLALDEPKETDEVLTLDGFTVVSDKALLEEMGGISVAYRNAAFGGGFIIRPKGEIAPHGCSC